jgi:hypothetical protein
MWSGWFRSAGFQEPYVEYVVIQAGQTFETDCTPLDGIYVLTADTQNMYYCPYDGDGAVQQPNRGWDAQGGYVPPDQAALSDGENLGGIVFPVLSMQRLWTGDVLGNASQRAGDFAAAIIVAHEYGHHVTDEWAAQYNALYPPGVALPGGKYGELLADCFAGVWANSAYYKGLLEPGDIEEGVAAMSVLGDKVANGPAPHGTSQERQDAVWHGYNTGSPQACAATYWRAG